MDESYSIENKLSDVSICSLKLPSLEGESLDGVLDPGMTTLIPLFLRGDRMGKHQFRFVFGYQAEVC